MRLATLLIIDAVELACLGLFIFAIITWSV